MTCWLTFLDYASSGLAWLLQWEGNYEDNEVIFCHTIVALMKVCATVKLSTLIPNSWEHLGATHFHLIPHSHGNTSGQPTSISSHILMATPWGNPLPSHPTFSWQHLGATHFHLQRKSKWSGCCCTMERAGTASSTSETSWALWGKMLIHGCGW